MGVRLRRIAGRFARIASCMSRRASSAEVTVLLRDTQALCEAQGAGERSRDTAAMLANLATALQTWRDVWPRLGGRREFRQAVAREARLWSTRLEVLAPDRTGRGRTEPR